MDFAVSQKTELKSWRNLFHASLQTCIFSNEHITRKDILKNSLVYCLKNPTMTSTYNCLRLGGVFLFENRNLNKAKFKRQKWRCWCKQKADLLNHYRIQLQKANNPIIVR